MGRRRRGRENALGAHAAQCPHAVRTPQWNYYRSDDVVEELFAELSDTHPQAYISMICGMSKYCHGKRAYSIYNEALDKQILCEYIVYFIT